MEETERAERIIKEVQAAADFVHSIVDKADGYDGVYPLWHGWAISQGFYAGIEYERKRAQQEAQSPQR